MEAAMVEKDTEEVMAEVMVVADVVEVDPAEDTVVGVVDMAAEVMADTVVDMAAEGTAEGEEVDMAAEVMAEDVEYMAEDEEVMAEKDTQVMENSKTAPIN